jgi:hypothetical protein
VPLPSQSSMAWATRKPGAPVVEADNPSRLLKNSAAFANEA